MKRLICPDQPDTGSITHPVIRQIDGLKKRDVAEALACFVVVQVFGNIKNWKPSLFFFFLALVGRGVVTREMIEPSAFVVEYRGDIIPPEEIQKKKRQDSLDNFLFDFSYKGTNWRWVNYWSHNLVFKWSVRINDVEKISLWNFYLQRWCFERRRQPRKTRERRPR